MANELLRAALQYADDGIPILPLDGKRPLKRSRGYKSATTDKTEIRRLWRERPSANVGGVMGKVSGLVCVDVDGAEGERALIDLLGTVPKTLEVRTHKGRHLFFSYPDDGRRIQQKIGLRPKLDILGDESYVVLPPSLHPKTGERYKWVGTDVLAPLPEALIAALSDTPGRRQETKTPQWLREVLKGVKEGKRNDACARLAGYYLAKGLLGDVLEETLLAWNERNQPPLPVDEVRRAMASITSRDERGHPKRTNQAEVLIGLAGAVDLFHTADRQAFVTFGVKDHEETWPIRSDGVRQWLRHLFYEALGKPPHSRAVLDTIEHLEAKAQFDGPQRSVYVRVAELSGAIYVDLANERWDAVEITESGWRLVSDPPVRFRRARGMKALPDPKRAGSLDTLRQFVNVTTRDWALLLSWLVAAYRPTGPYPVLVVQGEQGSCKSTLTRVVRSLVDPSTVPLRTMSGDERDLMISAQNSWVAPFDNVSRLSQRMSDAICRLATGGGFTTRELYSDNSEVLFDAQRPVILNGIEEFVERDDLRDRALILSLPYVPDEKRRDEKTFWRQFEAARPQFLGALFDALAVALKNITRTELPTLPRMADFARWAVAAEPGLGLSPGSFLRSYKLNRRLAIDLTIESDPVAQAVRKLVVTGPFDGTASQLQLDLKRVAEPGAVSSRGWPPTASHLSGRLKRAMAALREVGITVEYRRAKSRDRQRLITITRAGRASERPKRPKRPKPAEKRFPRHNAEDAKRPR